MREIATTEISIDETTGFLTAIKTAFNNMTHDQLLDVHLYDSQRNAIVISFDAKLKAFFGYKKGYNHPEDRTYIKSEGIVLWIIRSKLKSLPHKYSGGRVFLTHDCVFRVNKDYSEEIILKWIWPSVSLNIVTDVMNLHEQALNNYL